MTGYFFCMLLPLFFKSPTASAFATSSLRKSFSYLSKSRAHLFASFTRSMSSNHAFPRDDTILIVAGPTGVGKSDVAAQLCNLGGMVISADSVQAYRGVQIGANKPTQQELEATPHLLIDVASPKETYNAAEWRCDALYCIQELLGIQQQNDVDEEESDSSELIERQAMIRDTILQAKTQTTTQQHQQESSSPQPKRQKVTTSVPKQKITPIVVGGTMMYIQWLLYGRPDAVRPSSEALAKAKKDVDQFRNTTDWEGAVKHVSSMGPTFARRIQETLSGQDWYRLRRTLEVAYTLQLSNDVSEESLYSGQREGALQDVFPDCDVRCFFLCPKDRMHHATLLDGRCEDMVMRGLMEETSHLHLSQELPEMASRAIGYRQTLEYLQRDTVQYEDAQALTLYLENFCTATRRYAKKQMQWFRKDLKFFFVGVDTAKPKKDRIKEAARSIQGICNLTRDQYEAELASTTSESSRMRRTNEDQGKGMKFYQYKPTRLTMGSPEFADVLKRADECTRRIQQQQVNDAAESKQNMQTENF